MSALECPVCHKHFTEPKILPCAHLLCRNCVVECVKKTPDALCFVCRSTIIDREVRSSQTGEHTADSLPSDLAMAAVVESTHILDQKHSCSMCDKVAAHSLCLHCGVMLCGSCVKIHGKFPALRSHKLEELSNLTPETLAARRQTTCCAHADQTAEVYCPTHAVSICHLCAASKHRPCPDMAALEESLQSSRQNLLQMETELISAQKALQETVNKIENQLAKRNINAKFACAEIDAAFDRIKRSVDVRRNRLKKLVFEAECSAKTAALETIKNLKQKCTRLSSHRELIQRVCRTAPGSSLGVMATALKSRMLELDLQHCVSAEAATSPTTLTIDCGEVERIERQISELGELNSVPASVQEKNIWGFHDHCGKNVIVSKRNTTATRLNDYADGVVMSSNPMTVNMLYEVRVDAFDPHHTGCMRVGVVLCNPSKVELARDSTKLNPAIVIRGDGVFFSGVWSSVGCGKALTTLKQGSRLGVLINASGCLRLFVDGRDVGTIAKDVPKSCYAMFDLFGRNKKVTALPLTAISR